MRLALTALPLLLLAAPSYAQTAATETSDDLFRKATAAVAAAASKAQADLGHPIFHLTAPAQWINDPNGPIFHKGYYHLFYQLHPFSERSGPKYWGHVRSRDLVKWEPLPIALCPSPELDETEIWSGCCTINGLGKPMIFYTSIERGKNPGDHAEQWAATSDDSLLHWTKSPANPVLSEALHGERKIYDWRDPFVFHEGHRTFLVTGGNLNRAQGGQATVNLYEAQNPELTRWVYRGIMFRHPDSSARTIECPNFFQLGKKWVLLVSPYGQVQYFVGDFNSQSFRFTAEKRGVLDFGPNFYAPNTMQVPDGRRLVWGWLNGFPDGHGWNGCLSVPRQLRLSRDGDLLQEPAPQLAKLHGKPVSRHNLELSPDPVSVSLPEGNAFEIDADLDLRAARSVTLELGNGATGGEPLVLRLSASELEFMKAKVPLYPEGTTRRANLQIFLDHSVVEVFANGMTCLTKAIKPSPGISTLLIRSEPEGAGVRRLNAYPMDTLWSEGNAP